MADHAADDSHDGDVHGHEAEDLGRVTSPMQGFSMRDAGVGFLVLAVGVAVSYVVPFLLA